jgi:AraC family transcriptional regulator
MLQGYADPTNRKIDGKAAPKTPSRAGELSFFRIGSTVTGYTAGNVECLNLLITPSFVQRFGDSRSLDRAPAPWVVGFCDVVTQTLVQELATHLGSGSKIQPLLVDGAASIMTLRLMEMASNTNIAKGQLTPARLEVVLDYIESNLGRDIRLAELAEVVGLSTGRFCHAFRNSTGLSPHRYLIKRRIESAKFLLRRRGMDVTEIALGLGFNSQSHFSSAFRKMTGITPLRYSRQNR